MSVRSSHRAWIEVDHGALIANLAVIRQLAPERQVIAVVKANAYGHGDVEVARSLVAAGVERLAVATLGEGLRLRRAGLREAILLLFRAGEAELGAAIDADLELTIFDPRGVAEAEHAAAAAGRRASVHLKVDTGLARQGADPGFAAELGLAVQRSRDLRLVGTYTHLAVPGEDDAFTDVQLLRLARTLDAMRSSGVDPGLVHAAASGGILAGVASVGDAVRPGLVLYGLVPAWAAERDVGLRPVLSLRALPLRLFDLPAGEPVGYGLRYRAERMTRIATLAIGYGDGWPRLHANNGWVLVRGRRAPIVGAISMDAITVDIGQIDDVTYDDEFVLVGEQGAERISADEIADQRRTISYEVTTALRERLPRIHLGSR